MADTAIDEATFGVPLPAGVVGAAAAAWAALGAPGPWWDGAERVAIAAHARDGVRRPPWDPPPDLAELGDIPADPLGPFLAEVVRRVAVEASALDRATVDAVVERLGGLRGVDGHGPYAELVAVVAQVVPVDHLCLVLDRPRPALPAAQPGHPSGARPAELDDIGAFVPVDAAVRGPNIGRAVSLVEADNVRRLGLVTTMYAGGERFQKMVWEDRPLARPQVELLAARTSALNECFY